MPFYVLLCLLVLDKFSQSWQRNKFGCGDMVEIYESIEKTQDLFLKKREEKLDQLREIYRQKEKEKALKRMNTPK